jgi:hypothetical protein
MKLLKWIISVLAFGPMLLHSQCSNQVSGLPVQSKIVVKLQVHRNGEADELGSAIYVGQDKQQAYFITAFHLIGPDKAHIPVQSVEIYFGDSPRPASASVFQNFKESLDLAVVTTAISDLPTDLPHTTKGDVEIGSVHIVGNPPAGESNVWTGTVQNKEAEGGDIQHFTTNFDKSLTGGYSGGAVFDSYGHLIGMHTASSQGYGIALKMSEVVPQLEAWRVPTNNIVSGYAVNTDNPEPDWEALSKEKLLTANELELGGIGATAFDCGKFQWSLKFLERAKEIQKSKVWQINYPFYAADLIILGKPQEGQNALQEMVSEMSKQYVFLSHGPPIAQVIGNLEKAKLKVPAQYRAWFDAAIQQSKQKLQDICAGNVSRPCRVALGQSQL